MTGRIDRPVAPGKYGRQTVLIVGNYLPSLAAARSLASAGYRVIAGDGGEFSTVARSRACHEVWPHPPVNRTEAFLAALIAFLAERPEITTLLPLQERYLAVLAMARERMPARVVVAMPDSDVVLTCLDKERVLELAREVGVPCRSTIAVSDLEALTAGVEATGYPSVIRPRGGIGMSLPAGRKAVIARDRAEFDLAFPLWPDGHPSLLVQRYVDGPRHNIYFAARAGRVLAAVETKILRTDRPDGTGFAVEGVTVVPDPRLARATRALIERLGYTGVGCVQFLVPDSGDPHLLEINPRHGAAMAIAVHCGLDLTLAAVGLATEASHWEPAPRFAYPVGRRYAWTSGDLNACRVAFTKGEITRQQAAGWVLRAIASAFRAHVHVTWSVRDPAPTAAAFANWLPGERLGRWTPPAEAGEGWTSAG